MSKEFHSKLFVKCPQTKDEIYESIFYNMALKTRQLFEYEGLPDSLPSEFYEAYLQRFGFSIVFNHDTGLVTTFGGFGGEPNGYYIPTKFIVANPYLNVERTFIDREDCVVHKNNSLYSSTYQLNARYAMMLTELELSMRMGIINTRVPVVFNASDKDAKLSVESFYDDVEQGKNSVVMSDFLFETLKSIPFGTVNNNYFTQYIETYQYITSQWWAEYGIDSVNNMKREALSEHEIYANAQTTKPMIVDMLESRQNMWKITNEIFGSNVSVKLNTKIYGGEFDVKKTNEGIDGDIRTIHSDVSSDEVDIREST